MAWPNWNIVLPISMLVANATIGNKVTYNDLIEQTVTIVRSCTMFDPNDSLLLAGEYEDFFQRSLLDDIPVALIAESKLTAFKLFALRRYSFTMFKQFSFLHMLWKLDQFLVVASSQPMLRLLLQRIKDSPWANFNGFHILIDTKTEKRGCANAYNFLWTAWEYDGLFTIFLCIDPIDGIVLYTYDPYSNASPNVWRNAGYFKGRSGHPWILLKRKYQPGSKICEDLFFDKTRNLNGYEVRMNAISLAPHLSINQTYSGLDKFSGDNSEIVKIVFEKLNASLNVRVYNGTEYDLGGIDKDGNMVGMLEDVATGEVDMGMNVRSLYAMWKVGHTYPHGQDGVCVITKRAGEISEFFKILSFISPPVVLGNIVVFTIAFCALSRYQGFLSAFLNVIRLVTAVSMHRLPRNISFRIFFSNLFILILIMNSLLQSHWASLVTVPVSLPNIRTPEDLKKSKYQIYGSMLHMQGLQDSELRSRFHPTTYYGCKQHVLDSQQAACLGDCNHLYERITNEPYFYRSKIIQQKIQVYVTRHNWPLFTRVTRTIRRTIEAGLVTMWEKLYKRKIHNAWKRKQANKKRSFRTLKIKHVSFSFYLLAIGYSCAIVVFIVELIVGREKAARSSQSASLAKENSRRVT